MPVKLSIAPLEGLTGYDFRRIHASFFSGADRYYTPFLSPIDPPGLTSRAMREIAPENNVGVDLVPQLLTNRADHFLAAAQTIASLGYQEVNLNLGCPSGTVVSKGKASGLLNDPDAVDRLLDGIFSACPIAVSVKTRIGRFDRCEIEPLMQVYNRYPLAELIVHPRIRTQMYRGKPDLEAFSYVMSTATMPVVYNGDIFTVADAEAILRDFPAVSGLMMGRGVMTRPSLPSEIKGEGYLTKDRLRSYYDALYQTAEHRLSGSKHLLHHMKEVWSYLVFAFENSEKWGKQIKKATKIEDFHAAVDALFASCELKKEGGFSPDHA